MIRNRDYEAFIQIGIGDDYNTVGNYNLFMQCETPDKSAFRELPTGFFFRLCQRDELEVWKRVVAEEQYVGYVTEYYKKVYEKNADEFFHRCLFVCNADDKPIASTFIWRSYEKMHLLNIQRE